MSTRAVPTTPHPGHGRLWQRVLFPASTRELGTELWALDLAAASPSSDEASLTMSLSA